jgi:hypothetical protein
MLVPALTGGADVWQSLTVERWILPTCKWFPATHCRVSICQQVSFQAYLQK